MTNPLEQLAVIAEREVGNGENPRGSNRGRDIAKYFPADGYVPPGGKDEGYAWCAAFVCWCVQQFLAGARKAEWPYRIDVTPPRTPAAYGLRSWGMANGCAVFTPGHVRAGGRMRPQRGDIVVFGFSHVGIVVAANKSDTNFASVEGNTDDAGGREGWVVARRARTLAQVELKRKDMGCFVRMPALPTVATAVEIAAEKGRSA